MDSPYFTKLTSLAIGLLRSPSAIWPYLSHLPCWGVTPVSSRQPWISFGAIRFLNRHLRPGAEVFEYGGGGSTFYFSRLARSVLTMESDPEWHRLLTREIAAAGLVNVTCEYHPISGDSPEAFQSDAFFHRIRTQLWDVILIDCYCGYSVNGHGETRGFALELALSQVKPGGIIILDDSWMFKHLLVPRPGWRITDYVGPGPCRYGVTSTAIFEKL